MAIKEAKIEEITTAVYKVNFHCKQCVREITQPLLRAQGVHKVDCDTDSGKITVKGVIDVVKMQRRIEKLSKKKVELVSPKPKLIQEVVVATEKKVVKETLKETVVRKTTLKVNMHCARCEQDLRRMLLRHKGIYAVNTDFKAQILMVEGSIESERLVSHIRNKINKHAEIVKPKEEKKVELIKEETKQEKEKSVVVVADVVNKTAPATTKTETVTTKTATATETTKTATPTPTSKTVTETSSMEKVQVEEFKEDKKVEVKDEKGNIPYFIHYVYAPQTFSDENPNACSIM